MKKGRSQNARILDHLLQGKSLTQLQATKLFNCTRLASRINDLKKEGWDIDCKMVKNYNTNTHYGSYSINK